MKLDLTNGLVVNDPVKATTYASSETGRILQTDFLDAVVEPEAPDLLNRLGSSFRLQIRHSATVSAYKHLPMPASGTVTAARIKLFGTATHNFTVRLYKKDKDATIGSNGTLVAEADYSASSLDISAANGTWVTLTMNSGSFDNDGSMMAEINNLETGQTLTIGFLELTTTLGDVTIAKL